MPLEWHPDLEVLASVIEALSRDKTETADSLRRQLGTVALDLRWILQQSD